MSVVNAVSSAMDRTTRIEIYLLGCVVLAALIYLAGELPMLTMGLDGVVYAAIANLLAQDYGSFWSLPYFDQL